MRDLCCSDTIHGQLCKIYKKNISVGGFDIQRTVHRDIFLQ